MNERMNEYVPIMEGDEYKLKSKPEMASYVHVYSRRKGDLK